MTEDQLVELVRQVLNPTALVNFAAVIISLICSYWPMLRVKWAEKDDKFKSLAMLITITVIIVIIALVSFTGFLAIVPATKMGVITLVIAWVSGLWTNATTFTLSPQTADVKAVKTTKAIMAQAAVIIPPAK